MLKEPEVQQMTGSAAIDFQHIVYSAPETPNRNMLMQKTNHSLNQAKIPIRSKLTSLEHEITAVKRESKKHHDKLSKKDIMIAQNEARLKSNMRSKKQAEDEIRALKRELILLSRVEDMKVLKSQLNLVCEKRSLNC